MASFVVKMAAKPAKPRKPAAAAKRKPAAAAKQKPAAAAKQKPAAAAKPAAAQKKAAAPKRFGTRADLGKPVDGFFARQPPHLRAILDELRMIVREAAPDATASLKWGMPFYTLGGTMMCALGSHAAHVNLILAGPPGTFADPDRLLEGDGKTGRHLKLRSLDDLPRAAARGWVRAAAERARKSV